ncbi:MAG: PadR family transcriptional regulator [Anaerolineae bacterium]
MSLDYAILGLLSIQPMTGYDLSKHFDSTVRHFWPATQSQIYRHLGKLDDKDWITPEVIPQANRPATKIYHLTETGERALHKWLATAHPLQESREPFLIQVLFANNLSYDEIAEVFAAEMTSIEDQLRVYEGIYTHWLHRSAPDQRGLYFRLLTLEFGLRSNQVYLDWLRSIHQRITAGDLHNPPLDHFKPKDD